MDSHGQGLSQRLDTASGSSVTKDLDVPEEDKNEITGRASNSNEETLPEPEKLTQALRMLEALLFASAQPLELKTLQERLPDGIDVEQLLVELQTIYKLRGVNLVHIGDAWAFRTASDLAFLMEQEKVEPRRLSKAAIETLAIIAYHQPVTRAEIEDIRGVAVSKGTLDLLMELDWVKPKGRRRVPGRPLTYGTNPSFLEHFGLESVEALPGLDDLKAAGLLEARLPPDFQVPIPTDSAEDADQDDLDSIDDEEGELPEFLDEVEPTADEEPEIEASFEEEPSLE